MQTPQIAFLRCLCYNERIMTLKGRELDEKLR